MTKAREETEKSKADLQYEAFKKWKTDFYEQQMKFTKEVWARDRNIKSNHEIVQ